MKKYKIKKKNFFVVGFIVFFFILIYMFGSGKKNYLVIEKITHELGSYFEKIFISKKENISNNVIVSINEQLESEVNELKKMLDLDINNYKFIHANVIKRDVDWYHEITIDKGKKDGIKLDMAVISNNGLIGRIIKTTNSSSVIKLLSSSNSDMKVAITVKTNDNEINGIIDDYLENEKLIQVNNILKTANIEIGDKVYTNGLGGIYPSGIYIGEVVDVLQDDLGLNKILKVKTDTSFSNIRYVSVIDRS